MKIRATIIRTKDGQWSMRHDGPDVGRVAVTAPTREEAIEKLRGEIRYRLELCPCTGASYQYIQIEIVETLK